MDEVRGHPLDSFGALLRSSAVALLGGTNGSQTITTFGTNQVTWE
jgi:hypothetical protein